jgi:hypothetical protein
VAGNAASGSGLMGGLTATGAGRGQERVGDGRLPLHAGQTHRQTEICVSRAIEVKPFQKASLSTAC